MSTYNKEKSMMPNRASAVKDEIIDDIQEREEEDYEDDDLPKPTLAISEFDTTNK